MTSYLLPVAGGKIIGTPYQGTHAPGVTTPPSWESDNAVDIAVPIGTPVVAVAAGTIGPQFGSGGTSGYTAGLALHLNTPGGTSFFYTHMSRYAAGIRPGAKVQAGQVIGYSGEANGVAHLHFASTTNLNPLDLVKGLPAAVASTVSSAAGAAAGTASAALPGGCSSVLVALVVAIAVAVLLVPRAFGIPTIERAPMHHLSCSIACKHREHLDELRLLLHYLRHLGRIR